MRHAAVLVVRVPEDAANWRVYFEPEGADRVIASGEQLTITMTGAGPREIEIHPYRDGLVIWRPLDSFDVIIVDQNGQPVTDLW
jgi:hypothetical protein